MFLTLKVFHPFRVTAQGKKHCASLICNKKRSLIVKEFIFAKHIPFKAVLIF